MVGLRRSPQPPRLQHASYDQYGRRKDQKEGSRAVPRAVVGCCGCALLMAHARAHTLCRCTSRSGGGTAPLAACCSCRLPHSRATRWPPRLLARCVWQGGMRGSSGRPVEQQLCSAVQRRSDSGSALPPKPAGKRMASFNRGNACTYSKRQSTLKVGLIACLPHRRCCLCCAATRTVPLRSTGMWHQGHRDGAHLLTLTPTLAPPGVRQQRHRGGGGGRGQQRRSWQQQPQPRGHAGCRRRRGCAGEGCSSVCTEGARTRVRARVCVCVCERERERDKERVCVQAWSVEPCHACASLACPRVLCRPMCCACCHARTSMCARPTAPVPQRPLPLPSLYAHSAFIARMIFPFLPQLMLHAHLQRRTPLRGGP